MTRSNRHSAFWPLLTTSKILPASHLEEIATNSFHPKILPITLTHSRFCGASFKTTQSFQDFTGTLGGGATPVVAPVKVQHGCSRKDYRLINGPSSRPPKGSRSFHSVRAISHADVTCFLASFFRARNMDVAQRAQGMRAFRAASTPEPANAACSGDPGPARISTPRSLAAQKRTARDDNQVVEHRPISGYISGVSNQPFIPTPQEASHGNIRATRSADDGVVCPPTI